MMRSLWAGVSGLQAHQVAMDVEGNNIANVNTVGFKYSRANFADMLSQTSKIASAPEGGLGGTNAVQVGLGSSVASVSKIFSQGSLEKTDKATDIALSGDGFFTVSADGGKSYKFTRAGDFKFDANGMMVDSNGYVVQGWLRDDKTGKIDTSSTIQGIKVDNSLTMPAQPTSSVRLKANLNSGDHNEKTSPIFAVDNNGNFLTNKGNEKPEDFSALYNENGDAFNLVPGNSFSISVNGSTPEELVYGTDFTTTEDLRTLLANRTGLAVSINEFGKFEVNNTGGAPVSIEITDGTNNNEKFTDMLKSLNIKALQPGQSTYTQAVGAATHGTSIDIMDSLGSKHTLSVSFRKSEGNKWDTMISVPKPGSIEGDPDPNILFGSVSFNPDGSLASVNPSTIRFTGNNGSEPNQIINLDFGKINDFGGLTSFDAETKTAGISQDGYGAGDLVDVAIDPSGVVTGTFSNGKSVGLAKIAVARFTNNEGLMSEGGNIFIQSANSGAAMIGEAGAGGRGTIQSSYLEMSNVDLSRSLTKLIVVQRGFQSNSKTITTSDQMLNTLLQLKN
ncbi:MAG TPA: flagellar hook-basal body complex protein [Campylobacterales bacterium]|nr:flagellar hook-basal body complex protein [Campylobacterales bacterium]HIO71277.1 flagellar hook-basal body complex protein [Campylobacterales bacterium]